MARKTRDTPCGHAVFAEELRLEIGNKFSVMGVPMAPIVLPGFPALIRLAVLVSYMEHVGESDEPVAVLVRVPGQAEPAHRAEVDVAVLRGERPPDDIDPDDPVVGISTAFSISGLLLTEPGYIEVVAVRGSTEVKLGRHRFFAMPADQEAPAGPDPTSAD